VDVKIGVLALQGDVAEHIAAFQRALDTIPDVRGSVVEVREAAQIPPLDAIAIPGGESTTISRLIEKNRMHEALTGFSGGIFATCAGMVLMAHSVEDPRTRPLGLIDMDVDRNAFGRQRESFEADISIRGLDAPFHAVFIRAPVVRSVGPAVTVLAAVDHGIVAVSQGKHMALSFHPELGGDLRLHRLFLEGLGIA
jgi:5'-phosphate synthase pdxT subunit